MSDNEAIPQVDFTITSVPVVEHSRKLRAIWTVDTASMIKTYNSLFPPEDPLKDLKRMARNARRNERRRQNKVKSL